MSLSPHQNTFVRDLMKETDIAAPCSAKWSDMVGDEKVRFCSQCKLHVLNAAEMTDEEVLLSLQRTVSGEQVCMQFYKRADGAFLTQNCPVGLDLLRDRAHQAVQRVATWLSAGLSLLASCTPWALGADSETNGAQSTSSTTSQSGIPKERGHRFGGINVWKTETVRHCEPRLDQELKQLQARGASKAEIAQKTHQRATAIGWGSPSLSVRWYSEAIAAYESLGNWEAAASCCVDVATLYRNGLHDEAKATEFRMRGDRLILKLASPVHRQEQELALRVKEMDAFRSWMQAAAACDEIGQAARNAKDMRLSYYWARRMQQYKDYMQKPFNVSFGRPAPTPNYKLPESGDLQKKPAGAQPEK